MSKNVGLNNIISEVDLTDIYKILHSKQLGTYSFQNSTTHVLKHGIVTKTLSHKISLNKFKGSNSCKKINLVHLWNSLDINKINIYI